MHGGALALAGQAREAAAAGRPPQVLLASSMLDLPAYLALAPVGRPPIMLYFHENQLTYPLPEGVERDLGYGMRQVTSALAADAVFFNTRFHRDEFLAAVAELWTQVPDEAPAWALEQLAEKSAVLHVGCDLRRFDEYHDDGMASGPAGRWGDPAAGPLIVWNQRWEYDKAPGALFAGLAALADEGVPFRVAVAGPNQGLPTAAFVEGRRRLGDRVVQWGRLEHFADYAALLWAADVVVSTALHEFFGVAVVEALYCGCRPVLPRRLSYPELIPDEAHAQVLYDEGEFVPALRRAVDQPTAWSPEWQRTWVAPYDWGGLVIRYDNEVWKCWERSAARGCALGR
jgi:glycosyltransferase involved in cell wall biosynthesis